MLEAAKMANTLEVFILTELDAALAAAVTSSQAGWSALPYTLTEISALCHDNNAILPHFLEEKIPSRVQHRDN